MEWIKLDSLEQLEQIRSAEGYSVIFKHSTRCSISMMAKRSFEREWDTIPEGTPLYFLDLIAHRDISNTIATQFNVHHESPQILLIKAGECVLDSSHGEISADEIAASIGS